MNDERQSHPPKDEDMIYGLTVDEHSALRDGLRELPDTMPPRAVWDRIREQAEAEGLIHSKRQRNHWFLGAGVAAAIALTAIIVPRIGDQAPEFSTVPPIGQEQTAANGLNVLQALMVESRQLESDLRALPAEPSVVRAGTRAMILDLEDRIAAIDYQLSDPDVQLTPEETEIFWRERVRLMKSLVGLRYAQAQRNSF